MKIGFIGLGRMGKNMVLHLLEQGIDVVGYNRSREVTEEFVNELSNQNFSGQFTATFTVADLTSVLSPPRVVWLMVPNGQPVDDVINLLLTSGFSKDDSIIDGGNCFYKDSIRRANNLTDKGIHFLDCGTSGGWEGARHGACLMIGGEKNVALSLSWLWNALSGTQGTWTYFGTYGAGHFVKMVHNGVEYGMDQAIGEGFELLSKSPYDLSLEAVAKNWSKGSVVRGWLIELLARALQKDPRLEQYSGIVGGGETGRWTVEVAKDVGVETPVLGDALSAREHSYTKPTFAGKVVSALRYEYGGHRSPR